MGRIFLEYQGVDYGTANENCIFCKSPTPYWVQPNDVPVCPKCAEKKMMDQVIDKDTWIEQGRLN